MKPLIHPLLLAIGTLLLQGCATSNHSMSDLSVDEARASFEVYRSDFNAGKIRALNQAMKLTVDEANKFWPIYREYEKELAGVGDRKLKLISDFLTHHRAGTLTDENSRVLGTQWLQNIQDRLTLWQKYHQAVSEAVSPIRAAQFLQVENQMAIFVDLSIASEMPIVGTVPSTKSP